MERMESTEESDPYQCGHFHTSGASCRVVVEVEIGVGLSCIVEIMQFMTSRGLCEFDDVIHNAVGTAIGVSAAMIIKLSKKWI